MNKSKKQLLSVASAFAILPMGASGATIAWGASTAATADTDISTNGTVVFAINGGGANVTLNTVAFTGSPTGTSAGGYTIGDFYTKFGNSNGAGTFDPNGTPTGGGGTGPYDALSGDYQNLMSSAIWPGNPNTAQPYDEDSVTISNLTIGDQYEIQIWVYDGRNGRSGYNMEVDGNVLMSNDDTGGNAADGIGHFMIGTFVADAATQSFDLEGFTTTGESQGRAQVNAIQLRTIPIPEPSSGLLVALAGFGLALRRRR